MNNSKKYHVNPETGKVNTCSAQDTTKCKYAKDGVFPPPHFNNKEDAKIFVEISESLKNEKFTVFSKNSKQLIDDSSNMNYLSEIQNSSSSLKKPKKIEIKTVYHRDGPMPSLNEFISQINNLTKSFERDHLSSNTTVFEEFNALKPQDEDFSEHNEMFERQKSVSTKDELDSISEYVTLSYDAINRRAVSDYFDEKDLENPKHGSIDFYIKNIDSYIAKASNKPKRVFRTIDQSLKIQDYHLPSKSEEWLKNELGIKSGEIIQFDNFLSTSTDPGWMAHLCEGQDEHTSVVFVIDTSQGAPVNSAALDRDNNYATQEKEREILLPRKMKFHVDKVARCRFRNHDGNQVEPLTVYLTEFSE